MGRRRKLLGLCGVLAMAVPACAQFVLFPGDTGVHNKPIVADVTVAVTSNTPWGPYTQTQTGKYWRSRDGKTRRDDAFGNSHVEDLYSRIDIDHEAKVAYEVNHFSENSLGWDGMAALFVTGGLLPPFYDDPAGLDPELLRMPRKLVKIGEKEIDGRKVTGRRSTGVAKGYAWGPKGDHCTYEVWTANDLKLAIEFQYKTSTMQVLQRLENIQMVDPDPEIFEIPKGYQVRSSGGPWAPLFNKTRIQK